MGKPVNVNNLLSMRIDVIDRSGASVPVLGSTTLEPRQVTYVENISGRERSVKFLIILPNGTNRMEFTGSDVSADRWSDQIDNIPNGRTRDRRRSLKHNSGPDPQKQPIQCDEVEQVLGKIPQPGDTRTWRRETQNVPFDHEIDVGS